VEPRAVAALCSLNKSDSAIDNEGIFWAVDFTKDAEKHPILMYAGRDWGYKETPKKTVAAADGLRIRLRATTTGSSWASSPTGKR
jgi:hypothetical protein